MPFGLHNFTVFRYSNRRKLFIGFVVSGQRNEAEEIEMRLVNNITPILFFVLATLLIPARSHASSLADAPLCNRTPTTVGSQLDHSSCRDCRGSLEFVNSRAVNICVVLRGATRATTCASHPARSTMDIVPNLDPERVANLTSVQFPTMINRRIAVLVRVVEVPETTVTVVNGVQVNTLGDVIVQDRQQTEMTVIGVAGNDAVTAILNAHRTSSETELEAEVGLRNDTYVLTHLSMKKVESALQLVGATPTEIQKAEDTVAQHENGLLDFILGWLTEILGIKIGGNFPIMTKALKAVILQAVSAGKVNGTPGRVHILLFGPPAVGKGMVNKSAALLGTVCQTIGSNSVTPAGLIGSSSRIAKNRMRVHPGALVLANGGIALMEDAQLVDSFSRRHTFGIFSDMMEKGRLIRTNAGMIDLEVDTALLMDLNPKSTTRPAYINKEVMLLDDLDLPVNLLSRLDLVFAFPRDVARQMETTMAMLSGIDEVGPGGKLEDNPKVRELRVLVAYLRDGCPTVKLGGVTEIIKERITELFEQNKEKLQSLHLAGDFLTRGGKSVLKLVAAAARLRSSCEATEEDVSLAFDLSEEKMNFLSMIETQFEAVSDWKSSPAQRQKRWDRIVEHFGNKNVDIKDVCGMFPDLNRRTVLRDLNDIGAKSMGNGVWSVPAPVAAQA